MIKIQEIIELLEQWAPPAFQEDYDNSGLITGNRATYCDGVLCTLDATETVVDEAIERGCNLIVAHHPIVFRGLKKLSGGSYPERALIKAIKNDIAIYALHTNLDNIRTGVNQWLAEKTGLRSQSLQVLAPKKGLLNKLTTYVPVNDAEQLRTALFAAGAGGIGNYDECSFNTTGTGTFRPLEEANPHIGTAGGPRERVEEVRIEMVFPVHLQTRILHALHQAHPYETVAYNILALQNEYQDAGSGLVGELPGATEEKAFLAGLKAKLGLSLIRHSPWLNRPIRTVAVCGGAGSFLIQKAIQAGADVLVTSDLKYHEFFEADGRILLADVGHFESEQWAIDGIATYLTTKFPTFAVRKTRVNTNPVRYFV